MAMKQDDRQIGAWQDVRDYWVKRLEQGQGDKVSWPVTYGARSGFTKMAFEVPFSADLARSLRKICRENDASMFVFLFAVYQVLLHKYTDEGNLTITVPVLPLEQSAERKQTSEVIPVAMQIQPDHTFREWLREVQQQLKEDWMHADVSLQEIAGQLGWRDETELLGRTLFGMTNVHGEERMTNLLQRTCFDVMFQVKRDGESIAMEVVCNGQQYDSAAIQTYVDSYLLLLSHVLEQAEQGKHLAIAELPYTDQEKWTDWMRQFNDTQADYDQSACMQDRFEQHAQQYPQDVAIRYADGAITYQQLDEKANQWAHLLRQSGMRTGDHVGIIIERTPHMLVAVLAVLKAGGAYVPMEQSFPKDRIRTMVEEMQIAWVMTTSTAEQSFQSLIYECACIRGSFYMDVMQVRPPRESANDDAVQQLFDHVADQATDEIRAGGFVSSYTGEPFTEAEVKQYQTHVMKLIEPYLHAEAQVLEIGCGSGWITYPMAAKAGKVWAMDPSAATLERNQRMLAETIDQGREQGLVDKIAWIQGFAHDLPEMEKQSLDVIVIASTVQFFPGLHYLTEVLDRLQELLKPGGHIVLADLLDAQQKEDYFHSLRTYAQHHADAHRVKQATDEVLYVHERALRDLCARHHSLEMTHCHYRDEAFPNELQYRFDVRLTKVPSKKTEYSENKVYLYTGQHADAMPNRIPDIDKKADQTAYVIFTSGSTGKPKGVVVSHRPVLNLLEWAEKTFHFGREDTGLFVTSLCFDLSVFDIFGMLSYGGTIWLVPEEEVRSPERLLNRMFEAKVTFWNSAPAALQQLVPFMDEQKEERQAAGEHVHLRLVYLSGDWIPLTLPDRVRETFSRAEVVALGGATEATVWSNYYLVQEMNPSWNSIPYGYPIQNTRYYVLNSRMELCPPGIPGELYIGGACLATGYTDAMLTASRFIPDPYANSFDGEAVMYRTGDLARWCEEGYIEFLGRIDHQVKIRGYRVELGEIQSQLLQHEAMTWALVIDRTDSSGEKSLCAYYMSASELETSPLRAFLAETLPAYMIPAHFVRLEQVPVTPNGKLDRKALPQPGQGGQAADGVVAPQSQLEQLMARVWCEVLDQEQISTEASFFDLGGHSFTAMTLVNRLADIDVKIKLSELYEYPTIHALSAYIQTEYGWEHAAAHEQATIQKQQATHTRVISEIRQNEDTYSWDEVNCFYKPFAIAMQGFEEEYFDQFLFYSSMYTTFAPDGWCRDFFEISEKSMQSFFDCYDKVLEPKFQVGIREQQYESMEEMHACIISSINQRAPVIVPVDLFHLYYYNNYGKTHHVHHLLIKGYDESTGIYYMLDNMQVDEGSRPVYRDFMVRKEDLYEMNQSYFSHFYPHLEQSYFWVVGKEGERAPHRKEQALLDVAQWYERVEQDPSAIVFMEEEVLREIRATGDVQRCWRAAQLHHFKRVFYDILLKWLREANANNLADVAGLEQQIHQLQTRWSEMKLRLMDEISQPAPNLTKVEQEMTQVIDLERAFRLRYLDVISALQVKEQTSQSKEEGAEHGWIIHNVKGADIQADLDQAEIVLPAHQKFDTWIQQNHAPQLLVKPKADEDFVFECEVKFETAGKGFHLGTILYLSNGMKFLFGYFHDQEMTVICPEYPGQFELSRDAFQSRHFHLRLQKTLNTCSFQYKQSSAEQWETSCVLELTDQVESYGLMVKTFEPIAMKTAFLDIVR
ncbi:AMP-binding protein [Marinicrinis sediminis]|uniref:AMP-binding protein n=1 Tax=Marinicrinis sediminis TaxID=1652465 RepID=A0ABW5R5A4_9BACL